MNANDKYKRAVSPGYVKVEVTLRLDLGLFDTTHDAEYRSDVGDAMDSLRNCEPDVLDLLVSHPDFLIDWFPLLKPDLSDIKVTESDTNLFAYLRKGS